ncbi:formyl-coenzyme A transferase [Streptomyces turgidiscabies]|nr:formyl-coenzyme A transferase [Streptomyces turgidiscabies]
MIVSVEHPERGHFTTVGNPLKLSDSPTHITTPPLLGQHTADILIGELGVGEAELPTLRAQGVI